MARLSSPDALARHLLRHLSDPRELVRNDLVTAYVRAQPAGESPLARYNSIVRWAHAGVETLAACAGRNAKIQAEILRRCDFAEAAHGSVASELGLSRRAFYYHRRAALVRLAHILSTTTPSAQPLAERELDAFETRLAAARRFEAAGRLSLARDEAIDLVRCSTSVEQRMRAWSVVVEAHLLAGSMDEARGALARLEELLENRHATTARQTLALLESATSCALAHWNLGDAASAFARLSDVERAVRRMPRLPDESDVLEAWVRALLFRADFSSIAGHPGETLQAIHEARVVLDGIADAPADLRAQALVIEALVTLTLDRPLAQAVALAREALSLSQRHGLIAHAVQATTVLCLVQAVARNDSDALNSAGAGLALADGLGSHQAGIFLRLTVARVHAANGQLGSARTLLANASRAIRDGSGLLAIRDSTAASIALAAAQPLQALRLSREASQAAQRSGFGRIAGAALASEARALHALGQARAAADAADAAVALLERGSTRYTLADAYALSGRLTRNLRHVRRASELRSVLNAPA